MRHTLRGGGDITDMLRAYRLGHELVWQRWSDYVSTRLAGDEVLTEVLAHSSRHMFTFIDRCCDHLVREYRTEFGTMRPSGFDREPAEVVRELLGEGPIDESAASAQLRHDVRGHHIALVAAPLEAGGDAPLALDAVSRAAGGATLRLPVGDSTWWAWLTWPAEPSPAALAAIVATDLHGVLITMGDPGKGRAGFRRSHHQAREADRAARVGSAPPAKVVRHRDVELAGVLCTDPDRAQRLAEDRLGALAARNETCARLRETLLVFISLGCSKTRTAAQLHLHHKTVSYRLAQAEELLGRSPTEDVLELGTALLINRTLRGN
jgi:DNA-binding PucR family transcriptional regulator